MFFCQISYKHSQLCTFTSQNVSGQLCIFCYEIQFCHEIFAQTLFSTISLGTEKTFICQTPTFNSLAHTSQDSMQHRAFEEILKSVKSIVQHISHFFFFPLGLSKCCFMPPPFWKWNFTLVAVSETQGESNCVVSWSTRCVYFVRPDRPKFLTQKTKIYALFQVLSCMYIDRIEFIEHYQRETGKGFLLSASLLINIHRTVQFIKQYSLFRVTAAECLEAS